MAVAGAWSSRQLPARSGLVVGLRGTCPASRLVRCALGAYGAHAAVCTRHPGSAFGSPRARWRTRPPVARFRMLWHQLEGPRLLLSTVLVQPLGRERDGGSSHLQHAKIVAEATGFFACAVVASSNYTPFATCNRRSVCGAWKRMRTSSSASFVQQFEPMHCAAPSVVNAHSCPLSGLP